jgi:hypothetical protein
MLFGLFCFILSNSEATSAPGLIAHLGSPTEGFVSAEYELHPSTTSGEQRAAFLFFGCQAKVFRFVKLQRGSEAIVVVQPLCIGIAAEENERWLSFGRRCSLVTFKAMQLSSCTSQLCER